MNTRLYFLIENSCKFVCKEENKNHSLNRYLIGIVKGNLSFLFIG